MVLVCYYLETGESIVVSKARKSLAYGHNRYSVF